MMPSLPASKTQQTTTTKPAHSYDALQLQGAHAILHEPAVWGHPMQTG